MNDRYLVSSLLLLLLIIIICGCASVIGAETKNPTVQQINEKIKQAADISKMKEEDFLKLKKLYGINKGEVEEFVLYRAASNIKADEILIIKVKEPEQVNDVKEKILQRVDKQATSFKDYLPNEYYLVEKKVLKVKNNYILLAVSKDAQKVLVAFKECF